MRRSSIGAAVAMALSSVFGTGAAPQPGERRTTRFRSRKPSRSSWLRGSSNTFVPGGGAQERARRRRQIAAGTLRVENGLVYTKHLASPFGHLTIVQEGR